MRKLEQRVAQLERQVRAKKPSGDPAREKAAGAEISAIRKLVEEGKIDQVQARLEEFRKKYAGTRAARASAELAVVGKKSPQAWDIEKWYQGEKEVDLTSSKPTLLIFWEVWCPHCRREVPKVQRLWETLHPKGLQIVGLTKITRSATEQKVTDFIEQQKLTYPIAKEKGGLSRYFGVQGIPAAAIIKDGRVVWRGHPAALSDKFLASLL
ncbi:MAG: TlpA disulfide reductase family protein [Acidobacteriota bacterium]|nr:TlpA disulfide reductase family protein [Acidobacteriota bacterium]